MAARAATGHVTVALARAGAAVTTRILRELRPTADRETIAKWADRAGVMLHQAGRPADTPPVTQEAVAIRRELAAASPDRCRPAGIGAALASALGSGGPALVDATSPPR